MTGLTPPPERACRRCGSADPSIRLVPHVLGPRQWQCQTDCQPTPTPTTLEQLHAAALPAPWEARGSDIHGADGQLVATVWTVLHGLDDDEPATAANAALIAAARNALPELIRLAREVERVTRERDSLARRCALRYEETEKLRAELEQWEATYGKGAHLPGALNPLKRVRRERDAARAEADRLRPVVDAARELLSTDSEGGESFMHDWAHKQLADAVDALDADAPTEPIAAHVQADPDLPPTTERALGNLVRAAADHPVEPTPAIGCPVHTVPLAGCPHPARGAHDAPTEPAPVEQQYLIWSHHHKMWWGPDGCGYRSHIADAGRYALADTPQWLGRGCGCCKVPEVVIPAPAGALVDLIRYGRRHIKKATAERIAAGQVNRYAEGGDPR